MIKINKKIPFVLRMEYSDSDVIYYAPTTAIQSKEDGWYKYTTKSFVPNNAKRAHLLASIWGGGIPCGSSLLLNNIVITKSTDLSFFKSALFLWIIALLLSAFLYLIAAHIYKRSNGQVKYFIDSYYLKIPVLVKIVILFSVLPLLLTIISILTNKIPSIYHNTATVKYCNIAYGSPLQQNTQYSHVDLMKIDTGKNDSINIDFNFRPTSFVNYPNIFQTGYAVTGNVKMYHKW